LKSTQGKILYPFSIAILLLFGCSPIKDIVVVNDLKTDHEELIIDFKKEVHINEFAEIKIVNKSKTSINIYGPYLKKMEKYSDNTWTKVRIIYYPCGADCEAPPKILVLKPGESHPYKWNLMESRCENIQKNGIPLTVEKKCEPGLYRIRVDYGEDENKKSTLYYEFRIIN